MVKCSPKIIITYLKNSKLMSHSFQAFDYFFFNNTFRACLPVSQPEALVLSYFLSANAENLL